MSNDPNNTGIPKERQVITNNEINTDFNKFDYVDGQSKERKEFLQKNRIDG